MKQSETFTMKILNTSRSWNKSLCLCMTIISKYTHIAFELVNQKNQSRLVLGKVASWAKKMNVSIIVTG